MKDSLRTQLVIGYSVPTSVMSDLAYGFGNVGHIPELPSYWLPQITYLNSEGRQRDLGRTTADIRTHGEPSG